MCYDDYYTFPQLPEENTYSCKDVVSIVYMYVHVNLIYIFLQNALAAHNTGNIEFQLEHLLIITN